MSSPSSRELPASTSESRSPPLKRKSSATSSSTPTAEGFCWPECLTVPSTPVPSGETCEPSTEGHGAEWWIASLAASRARTSAMPENEQASAESGAGCGPSSPDWLAKYDPDTCSWRTSALSLFEEWMSCLETFPTSGTMRNGYLYRRQPWEPRTSGNVSSSWPTPTQDGNQNYKGASPTSGDGLATIALLWPTPRACEGSSHAPGTGGKSLTTESTLWPTPRVSMESGPSAAEQLWRTPMSRDHHPTGRGERTCGLEPTFQLAHQVMEFSPSSHLDPPTETAGEPTSKPSRMLNPVFVELLQGFPIAWTDLKPLAILWCPCKLRQHLRFCLNG